MSRRRFTAAALTAAVATGPVVHFPPPAVAAEKADKCATATGVYRAAEPWPQTRLGLAKAWPLSTGKGVTVAVVATGVDADNAQFGEDQVLAGADVRRGTSSGARTDCDGRGTFAAGVIAAQRTSGTTFVGVAPDATILPVRYTASRDNNQNDGDARSLARGIRYATKNGADVIVIVSAEGADDSALHEAVDEALAADVVVVSAGPRPQQGTGYPTSYAGVLGVVGVGADGTVPDNADRSPAISVAAPGADLVGLAPGKSGHRWGVNAPGMAAAYAGGVVALMRAYRPKMKAKAVVQQIVRTATPLAAGGRTAGLGAGLIDPYAALTTVDPASSATTNPAAPVAIATTASPEPSARLRRGFLLAGGLAAVAALITLTALIRRRTATGKRV